MLAQDKEQRECDECGELRFVDMTRYGNICHQCEERLESYEVPVDDDINV